MLSEVILSHLEYWPRIYDQIAVMGNRNTSNVALRD
jgi:hypothetical protein